MRLSGAVGGRDAMRVTLRSAKLGKVEWSAMCTLTQGTLRMTEYIFGSVKYESSLRNKGLY